MQEDLVQSIKIAKKLLKLKKNELELLEYITEAGDSLSDDLLAKIHEMIYKIKVIIQDFQEIIASLEDQLSVFGEFGAEKHLGRLKNIDQPTDEISEIQQLRRKFEKRPESDRRIPRDDYEKDWTPEDDVDYRNEDKD